jgi:hypothetical protein
MPTIDQLDPVVACADSDLLPVSQGGAARRVTRAQLLAGVQTQVSLGPGLLGRSSLGMGGPERIAVGPNLKLADGVLSASQPFRVSELPAGTTPSPSDLIPISQGGRDSAIPARALVEALSSVRGADVSSQLVTASFGISRTLADWAGDAVPVEAFGAVGDGVTDDRPAFERAAESGLPVRLRARAYAVSGQWTITSPAVLIGTPGLSKLVRHSQVGGAWINAAGSSFTAIGVQFDAGFVPGDSWSVLISPQCTETLQRSGFWAGGASQPRPWLPNVGQ